MAGNFSYSSDPRTRIAWLRTEIARHNELYYNRAQPEIADDHYDLLLAELAELEKLHPDLATTDSPTQKVGAAPKTRDKKTAFPPHRHAVPMLSITNTYSDDEIRKFIGRVEGALRDAADNESPNFVVELKIDGVAMTAFYRDGKLVRGATRGDGTTGEDITENLLAVTALPKQLKGNFPKGEIEVRGEIFISSAVFANIVAEQEEEGAARIFANPRNATAGTLKLLDPEQVKARGLEPFFYQIVNAEESDIHSQKEALHALESWGLPVNPEREVFSSADDILTFRDVMDVKRHTLSYGTDGLVIKLNSFRQQEILGLGTRSPNWAVAYKFAPERAETGVTGIRVQVGKLGKLTPVADLEPVLLAGSTITHASLHNESYISEKDVRIGDRVLVQKAGEIIPQIDQVVLSKRSPDSSPFVMPHSCPVCGEESITTEKDAGDRQIVLRFCDNASCPARQFARIVHFASRDAMDIEGMGPSVVGWLLENKLLRDVSDIYHLTRKELLPMTKSGRTLLEKGAEEVEPSKMADNLISAIQTSKKRGLAKLLFALSIPDIGETAAQLLARRFGSLEALRNTAESEISAASLGESTSYRTLGDKAAAQLRKRLAGLTDSEIPTIKDSDGVAHYLRGLKITGFGGKKCDAVANRFGSLEALRSASEAELAMVEMGASQVKRTLGPVAARSIRRYLDEPKNRDLLERLKAEGVSVEALSSGGDGGVSGKVFVLTGTLPTLGRAEAKRIIEGAGGLIAGTVSNRVDYVVAGEAAGSKLTKAQELGVAIIDEAAMLELCGMAT